jgi:programmed cell death protein 4
MSAQQRGRGGARPDIHVDGDDDGTWTPEGSDSGVVLVDATEGPVSARAAREAAIAERTGAETTSHTRGALVAGSALSGRALNSGGGSGGGGGGGGGGSKPASAPAAAGASGGGGGANGGAAAPGLTLAAYKLKVGDVLRWFFTSEDYDETRSRLRELRAPGFGFEFVRRLLVAAMDRSDRECEMACRLLGLLVGTHALSMEQAGKGFERLFETIDDVEKDCPKAREIAGRFLARAVADETLPPAFVADDYVRQLAGSIAEDARALLSIEHRGERLRHLFHVTSAHSTPELKEAVELAVKEFLDNPNDDEVVRCIRELRVPMFGHEVVSRVLRICLDRTKAAADLAPNVALAMRLFRALRSAGGVVSEQQFAFGFSRVRDALDDLALDSPHAREHFLAFESAAAEIGLLQHVAAGPPSPQLPQRRPQDAAAAAPAADGPGAAAAAR